MCNITYVFKLINFVVCIRVAMLLYAASHILQYPIVYNNNYDNQYDNG